MVGPHFTLEKMTPEHCECSLPCFRGCQAGGRWRSSGPAALLVNPPAGAAWLEEDEWISNYLPSKLWDEITYPFPNFGNG